MASKKEELWLAPLRGVTIRAFREVFASALNEAGFTGAFAPFIPANPGIRVNDRVLSDLKPYPNEEGTRPRLVPQVISRHPEAMRELLKGFKDRGFTRADLNAGCPFPMIVRRGRGSGLFKTPDVLEKLIETGCDEMGPGNFSVKTRLGLDRPDELLKLMPIYNRYPLAALTVHARTGRQMYAGSCDWSAVGEVLAVSMNPVFLNGNLDVVSASPLAGAVGRLVGRSFIRNLGLRADASELLRHYMTCSQAELCGDHPVLGRIKELLSYWTEVSPRWHRLWPLVKMTRTVDELTTLI